jgi:integrase
MKTAELRNDKIIKRWLSGKRATEETTKSYLQSMHFFTDFVGKAPDELITEAEEEEESGKRMRLREVFSYLLDFREDQEKKRLAPKTIATRMAAVMSFYDYYNIQLPTLPKSLQKAKTQMKRKAIPTKEDIREVLKHANLRDRTIALVGVSSGLSVIDIASLKISDFKNGYDPETGITTLHIVRTKTQYEFYTFLSPEASKAVLDYLDWRNHQGECEKVTSDNGYLFISDCIQEIYRTTKKEEYRKMSRNAILKKYRALNKDAGKDAGFNEYNVVRSHNMRRFLNSTLLANSASIFFTDFILGHELDQTREAYFRADPASLKAEYSKYIPYITIEKQFDPSDSLEFKQMQHENERLARITAKTAVERDELQDLRAELDEMKKRELEKAKLEEVSNKAQQAIYKALIYDPNFLEEFAELLDKRNKK